MKLIQFFKKYRQFSVFLVLARSLVLKIRNRDYAAATVTGSKTPYMLGDSLRDILVPKTESGEGIEMLEIKDLTVSYQNIPTVQDFSLHMKRGADRPSDDAASEGIRHEHSRGHPQSRRCRLYVRRYDRHAERQN